MNPEFHSPSGATHHIHGRCSQTHVVLGSIAVKAVREAPYPVLVVRPQHHLCSCELTIQRCAHTTTSRLEESLRRFGDEPRRHGGVNNSFVENRNQK